MPTNFGWNHKNSKDWLSSEPLEPTADTDEALWELLNAYSDGEASPEEAARIEALLESDVAYVRGLSVLQRMSQSAQEIADVEPPVKLREGILAATSHRPTLSQRMAAQWIGLREAFAPFVGRYAFPALGSVAAAACALLMFLPQHATHQGSQVVNNPSSRSVAVIKPNPVVALPDHPQKLVDTHGATKRSVKSVVKHSVAVVPEEKVAMVVPKAGNTLSVDSKVVLKVVRETFAPTRAAKPETKRRLVLHTPSHSAQKLEAVAAVDTSGYYKRPMMDMENYHPTLAESGVQKAIEGPDVRPEDDGSVKVTTASDTESAVAAAATVPPPQPPARIRVARFLASQAPPDSRHMLTGADIKRIRDASMLGYDRETVESIQRKEPTIAFVQRF